MEFFLIDSSQVVGKYGNGVYLIHTGWDDWFTYETTYEVWFYNNNKQYYVGTTKIGSFNMKPSQKTVDLPTKFHAVPKECFSLGGDEAFYVELNSKPIRDYRNSILIGLRDIAYNKVLYDKAKETDVFEISLTRYVSKASITGRFRRLANGDASLTNYHFNFTLENSNQEDMPSMEYQVIQNQLPPSNIHTIIGRNGVGKSFLLNNMIDSLLHNKDNFIFSDEYQDNKFSNLLSVNFSTFENKEIFENNDDPKKGMIYYHLSPNSRANSKENKIILNDNKEPVKVDGINALFLESLAACLSKKPKRWMECIKVLDSDPVFKSINVSLLYKHFITNDNFDSTSYKLFSKLSSGHKIVLLTLTKLIELSEEKTLIIMDEPEMHLHPPLLGSFVRSLSSLLRRVNGVAILATHSPIVLQEVPKECVYKLNRFGEFINVERPTNETFGEEIGILTSDVFGLELTESGFHKLLNEAVNKGYSYEQIIDEFDDKLSRGASSVLRILLAKRRQENQ